MVNKHGVRGPLVEALSNSPILQFLGKHDPHGRELRDMLEGGQLHQFGPGEIIISQGETGDIMYVLATGSVVVSINDSELCRLSQPGDVFGELGALTGELRSATVTAHEAVTAFAVRGNITNANPQLPNAVFAQLIQQGINKILLARLRRSNEELVEIKKALNAVENQVVFLRMDNEVLNRELDAARKKVKEGMLGTPGGATI